MPGRIHFSAECLDPDDHVFTLRAPMQAGDAELFPLIRLNMFLSVLSFTSHDLL